MTERSVIIIGAGLAGLAAGIHAQRNGYRARIFEHAGQAGGVAVGWRRGHYHIDGGIHFLMGYRPDSLTHRIYEEVGAAGPGAAIEMTEYAEYVDERTGRAIRITRDLDRLTADWGALSPADAGPMRDLVRLARELAGSPLLNMGMGDPPELAGRLASLKQLWEMRGALRYLTGRANMSMGERAKEIRDPWLAEVYANLFLPEAPAWFVGMLLALLASGDMGLLCGGSMAFVRDMETCYSSLGGEITFNATVEQIIVEGDRAVGVRLADGAVHRAGAVISAADGRSTLYGMLGGKYLDARTRERYETWRLLSPMVMVSYGVAREFPADGHFRAFSLTEPLRVGAQTVPALLLRIFNYSGAFAPAGKTVIQATFDSEWDHWRTLRDDMPAYEAEKARIADEVIGRLERHYPGIASQVEVTDVATPYTTWRYTLNDRGAYEGWLPTARQMMSALPRTLPGLGRFAMAGQWVMPGGGVPTCIASGRDAVRILLRD
jgi:phytoene dehydrogenase-like protein